MMTRNLQPNQKHRNFWWLALAHALPTTAGMLALLYYWFAIADRTIVFLYDHDIGPSLDASPFSALTASRYWMAGLVAGAAVMALYILVNGLLGQLFMRYQTPE